MARSMMLYRRPRKTRAPAKPRYKSKAKPRRKATKTKRRATGGRMMQHAAPVQTGMSVSHGRRGPAGVGYKMQQITDTVTRITGRAYVGNVSSAGKVGAIAGGQSALIGQQNCLALIFDINPVLLNDRVAVIATTFEKYVYQAIKFTYIPQCPTSIGGSVGLVFDRDPLMVSADTQNTQFLSQVMSYEHAVLTPSYVPCSTAYARDPKELKTWFLGGTDATLTTRETSQGNLLVYVANGYAPSGTFNGGYGYIVMDYVLDLVAPTLMTNREQANNINRAPGQWLDCCGANAGTSATVFALTNNGPKFQTPLGTANGTFAPDAGWVSRIGGSTSTYGPGLVGEIQIGGITANGQALGIPTNLYTVNSTSAYVFTTGQKIYFCTHESSYYDGTTLTNAITVSFHLSLGSARASAALFALTNNATATINQQDTPDLLVCLSQGFNLSGWTRVIAPGATVALIN